MAKEFNWKYVLFFISTFIFILFITLRIPQTNYQIPKPRGPPNTCPTWISEQTITPLNDTKHLLVSAFMDQRLPGYDLRIIGIFKRDSIQKLYCLFCCEGHLSTTTPTTISQHSDNFGFPYTTTDVLCPIPPNCHATHVTLVTKPKRVAELNQLWLPVRNRLENRKKEFQFNFTVCLSTLFGDYNNVLQFAQTLEMYRLLGVNRVVIYNTSSGPDLDRLLQSYTQEGFVEVVPWTLNKYLNPSRGWLFSKHGGDMHYYGQQTTLNECIYRSMERSRYVILNDIDEIIMPYQHNNLMSLMENLQQQHPNTVVFSMENHIFPNVPFQENITGPLHEWKGVPGFNILRRIYRKEPNRNIYNNRKLIIKPRSVEQTSVHEVLKAFGQILKVPPEICHVVHCIIRTGEQQLEQLYVDTRLWDFKDKLVPSVTKVLRRAGLLSSEDRADV